MKKYPLTSDPRKLLKQLFERAIEHLGLSEEALRMLKWEGITSIGACLWFYVQSAHRLDEFSPRLRLMMYDQVELRIKEQGYWLHLLDADFWDLILWQSEWVPHSMMVMWQGQEQDLCQIPIKKLGLSETVSQAVEIFQVKTIGQWIKEYGYHYSHDHIHGDDGFIGDDLYFTLLDEILLRMKEQEDWPLIAENWYPD